MDFKQIKSIKTPESWIEKAKNIPQKKKAPVPFYLKPYLIASVASFVLCCTLCLTVFLNFNNTVPAPVVPNKDTSMQVNTEATDNTQQTQIPNTIPSLIIPMPTDVIQETTKIFINVTVPNESDLNKVQTSTSVIVTEPTEKPTDSVIPTETVKPSDPDVQTDPIVTVEPTEVPYPTDIPYFPTETPVEPMYTEPMMTEPNIVPQYYNISIYFTSATNYNFSSGDKIYCHIQSSNGISYSEKFSDNEVAYWDSDNRYVIYKSTFQIPAYTHYNVLFYDEHGHSYSQKIYFNGRNMYI